MKSSTLYIFLLVVLFLCSAQKSAEVNAHQSANFFIIDGMQVEWEFDEAALTFQLHAPYKGWVALGFNAKNDIVHSNLVMGAVDSKGVQMEEFFVANFADQQPIKSLGGENMVTFYQVMEDNSGTSFKFTLDTSLEDEYHQKLQEGQKIWLICAYSMEDDFGHHSIMRKHLEITL